MFYHKPLNQNIKGDIYHPNEWIFQRLKLIFDDVFRMIAIDLRTIYFSYGLTDLVCFLLIILLYFQTHKRFEGITTILYSTILHSLGTLLIFLRDIIPDFFSIVVANTLLVTAGILILIGLEQFTAKRSSQIRNYILLGVFFAVHYYFALVKPNLAIRILNISIAYLLIFAQISWSALIKSSSEFKKITREVGFVSLLFCVLSTLKLIHLYTDRYLEPNYLKSDIHESLFIIFSQLLFILLTYSLVLMTNKRLLGEISFQEEKFSKAFHSSPNVYILSRLSDGKIIEVNRGFSVISGYQVDEVLGQTTLDLRLWVNDQDRKKMVNELEKTGSVSGLEFKFKTKSGNTLIGLFAAEVLLINNEKFILSVINDITERIYLENQLIASEAKYRTLLENSTDPIYSFNKDGRFQYVNRAFYESIGKSADEILNKKIQDVFNPEEAEIHLKNLNEVIDSGEEKVFEIRMPVQEGERFFLTTITPVKTPDGKILSTICSSKDFTTRKKSELILAEQTRQLAELNASKDKFFSILAHDLKSPFANIIGFSELLKSGHNEYSSEKLERYIEFIHNSATHTFILLENLLDWARMHQGKLSYSPEKIRLFETVKDVCTLMSEDASKKGIRLTYSIDENIFVYADTNMLKTVIRNLVSNALKFTNTSGTVKISVKRKDDEIIVSIADNGIGIEKNRIEYLFSSVTNETTRGTENEKGTGLGLLLCKEFVSKNGGKIWVESEAGQGSIFRFSLPDMIN